MGKQSIRMDLAVPKGVILKPIPGISAKYKAGSDGRIYSYSSARTNARKPHPFALAEVSNGKYYVVSISDSIGKKRSWAIHKLICMAFHGEQPFPRACVCHWDDIWSNNKPNNLRWGSYAENEADKRRHGRIAKGAKQGSAKLTDEGVRIIRASIPYGLWNTRDAAHVFGVKQSTISQIARGVGWKHVI